ncbi:uncharacterized protein LOC129742380 [Uranotaenia lowii]|uniref:uncharacterized protein LOC129742380 n=1 Tax=Uranotaenia lowii TaxID=190385 RepID=UPI00247A35B8|nr:uncharacterized protein LOC129742380 [Uranotaenia lowii]
MSVTADPWTGIGNNSIDRDSTEIGGSAEAASTLQFEDNFEPVVEASSNNNQLPRDGRLPDSDSYLATLESRLKRLKTNPSVLQQLAERREACMQHLLNDSTAPIGNDLSLYLELDEPVNNREILRLIRPEQPLSVAEVVHLVNHDQLERQQQEQQDLAAVEFATGKDGEESGTESSTSR